MKFNLYIAPFIIGLCLVWSIPCHAVTATPTPTFGIKPLGWIIKADSISANGLFLLENLTNEEIQVKSITYSGRNNIQLFHGHQCVMPSGSEIVVEWTNTSLKYSYNKDISKFCQDINDRQNFSILFKVSYLRNDTLETENVVFYPKTDDLRNPSLQPIKDTCVNKSDPELSTQIVGVVSDNEGNVLFGGIQLVNEGTAALELLSVDSKTSGYDVWLWSNSPKGKVNECEYRSVEPEKTILILFKQNTGNTLLQEPVPQAIQFDLNFGQNKSESMSVTLQGEFNKLTDHN